MWILIYLSGVIASYVYLHKLHTEWIEDMKDSDMDLVPIVPMLLSWITVIVLLSKRIIDKVFGINKKN